MTGNPRVITILQAGGSFESHLNLQYRNDTQTLKFMGIKTTAKKADRFGDDAHRWLEMVSKRLLNLGGTLNYSAGDIREQTSLTALLQNDLALEMAVVTPYEQNIQISMQALDDTTRNLFEHLLKWHEDHVVWLERQLRLIAAMGENAYIAEKL